MLRHGPATVLDLQFGSMLKRVLVSVALNYNPCGRVLRVASRSGLLSKAEPG